MAKVQEMRAGDVGDVVIPVGLTPLGRAKVVNVLRSLPPGYAFHSDEPILRCIGWCEGFLPDLHNAAVEVIGSIGQHHPDLIGGSGWIEEGNRRMRLVAGVEVVGGAGAVGMSPAQLSESLQSDKAKRSAELKARAKAEGAAGELASNIKASSIEAAFAPPPAAASLGGTGLVRYEEEEDFSGEE